MDGAEDTYFHTLPPCVVSHRLRKHVPGEGQMRAHSSPNRAALDVMISDLQSRA